MLFLLAALMATSAFCQSNDLNASQKAAVVQMEKEVRQGCLEGVKQIAALKTQNSLPAWAKLTLASNADPETCACQSRVFMNAVTPAFFTLNADQKKLHITHVLSNTGCSLESLKKSFPQNCPGFVDAMSASGKGARNSDNGAICACMVEKIRPINSAQWEASTKAAFAPKIEGGTKASKQIGRTPLEHALAQCRK